MKKIILCMLIWIFCCISPASSLERGVFNYFTIREINDEKPTFGTYETEGFVIRTYECHPCQSPGECVPCEPEHIVISEENLILEKYFLSDKELILLVANAGEFEKGQRYRFLINVLDVKNMQQEMNNIKLIHYQKVTKEQSTDRNNVEGVKND